MPDALPFSQAAENNKIHIREVLDRHLQGADSLLEIGSGTAQHAVYFAAHFPRLVWQATDIPAAIDTVRQRIVAADLPNLAPPLALDVDHQPWPLSRYSAVFTANSLHIMSAASVENFFKAVGQHVDPGGKLLIYGPFKYGGEFTTESNAHFDLWLKDRDPASGLRDFEWVGGLAERAGFTLLENNAMPANNQMLVWSR